MGAVFERLLQVSLSGSIIVLAVLLLRLLLRKAPRRAVCLLWMLAVLRLLVPFEIQSDWSLQPEPPEFSPPAVQEDYFDSGPVTPQTVPQEYLENAVTYPIQQPPVPEEKRDWMDMMAWVWLAGAGILAIHGAVSYIRLKRRVRDAVILEEGVWISPGLDTAFVLGFFRPQIYLPVLTREEQELVLLHERCHIRRFDHWWKLLAYAAVSLHWFNPLAWVTYVLLCRDMELACDQETVRGMDNATRKAYSAALLRCAVKRSGIAACPVAFGEISVKKRIKMVLNYKKPGFWVTLIALIAAVAVGFFLLTSPKELTDLERCERALKEWQGMEFLHLRETGIHTGDYALNETSESDYWSSGSNALQRLIIDGESHNVEWWGLQDGTMYRRAVWEYDGKTEDTYWMKDTVADKWNLPWILALDWDAWEITHLKTEYTKTGMDIHLEAYLPEKGIHSLVFSFAGEKLQYIQRTVTTAKQEEQERNGILTTVSTLTYTIVDTDRVEIEKNMKTFGVIPELVWLNQELEALQNKQSHHWIIDMEIDSNYDGWDTCREEFLRSDKIWTWNFDYQTSDGPFTTSYLYYGAKLYATEYSEAGVVPYRPWEQIEKKGFTALTVLTDAWIKFPVLDILRNKDGSTVITLQGDLTPTENTTYYSKTYELHLDPEQKLTTLVTNYHSSKYISERGAQGTFEIRGKDILHILDTSDEEIRERILAVKREAIG